MTAIITTPFRILNAENFKEDVSTSNVYIGLGKTDAWSLTTSDVTDTTPFAPGDHGDDTTQARLQNLGIKKVATNQVSHVIPRHDWEYQKTFVPWDSSDSNIFNEPFYCLTSEFKVYKCLGAIGSSTVMPTSISPAPFTEDDGYTWKYMYTITAADSEAFLTNSYMPVKTLQVTTDLNDTDVDRPQQKAQQDSAALGTAGGIGRIIVTNGGSGYVAGSNITVEITGDGSNASVDNSTGSQISVNNGAIESINIPLATAGTDYTYANVKISDTQSGTLATARAVIAPKNGHGTDPVKELGGFYISVNVQIDGNESGDITDDNDFRQITILKNPLQAGGAAFTSDTGKGLGYIQLATATDATGFVADQLITGTQSGAEAFLVEKDDVNGKLYYYQNSKTGYTEFTTSDNIESPTVQGGGVSVNNTTATYPAEYDKSTGDIIFLENRNPITRNANQIEDIKCVIEF